MPLGVVLSALGGVWSACEGLVEVLWAVAEGCGRWNGGIILTEYFDFVVFAAYDVY